MSRIGKHPITVPAGVTVTIENNLVTVKGPKGELSRQINKEMKLTMEDGVNVRATTKNIAPCTVCPVLSLIIWLSA